jgi:hypothetical protein
MKWKVIHALMVSISVSAKIAEVCSDGGGLHHDQVFNVQTQRLSAFDEVEGRRQRVQLVHGHDVIGLRHVAAVFAGPVRLGDAGFQRQDGVGVGFAVLKARQLMQADDVVAIAVAVFLEALGVFEIIVAIAKAQAALEQAQRVDGRDRTDPPRPRSRKGD